MTPAARQVLNALEASGDDGCTAGELASVGGWSWKSRVHELRRAGHDIHDRQLEYFILVASTEPPASGGRPPATEAGLPRAYYDQAGAGGSVDAIGTQADNCERLSDGVVVPSDIPAAPVVALGAERLFDLPAASVYDLDAVA